MALALRLLTLGGPLSHDEGYSWLVASAPSGHAFLGRLAAYENTPPLFYLLLRPLPLDAAWSLRLPALVPGVLVVAGTWAALRGRAGDGPALLGALTLAVLPYEVSFSDYSRGFELAQLGLVLALWAALALATGGRRRWWWLWIAGGVIAVWSEYVAALALAGLAAGLFVVIAGPRRREVLLLAAAPVVTLAAWLPEMLRGFDALDVTKAAPVYPSPSPGQLRDVAAILAFGEHGAAGSSPVRWVQAALVAGVLVAAAVAARRTAATRGPATLLLVALAVAVVGHALCALAGPDVFAQRYLTGLLPLGAALLALGARAAKPRVRIALLALLVAAGVAVGVQRAGTTYEPSFAPVRALVARARPATVLTNSAVAVFELHGLHPVLDRPLGLGAGREARCPRPCLIVEDTRVASSPRPGPGPRAQLGPWLVRQAIDSTAARRRRAAPSGR